MALIFCSEADNIASLPNFKTEHILFSCQNGYTELKNGRSRYYSKEACLTYFKDKPQPSKTILLPECFSYQVHLFLKHVLGERDEGCLQSFYSFLCILNAIGTQNKLMLEKGSSNFFMDHFSWALFPWACFSLGKKGPSLISTLPNELLIKILSYLSTEELLKNVAQVSKHFYVLCKSPLLHQVITVMACENNADFLRMTNFLRRATMMTELHLHTKDGRDCQEVLQAIKNHHHLRVLWVYGCVSLYSFSFYTLYSSEWWENLIEFHVEVYREDFNELVKLPDFEFIMSKLGSKGNLTHLDFGRQKIWDGFSQVSMFNIIKGPNMKQLKNITIYKYYDESQMLEIVKGRKDSLEELKICNSCSSFDFVTLCPNIKHLSIQQTLVRDLLHILPSLKNLSSLEIFPRRHVWNGFEVDLLEITDVLRPDSLPSLTSLKLEVDCNQAEVN